MIDATTVEATWRGFGALTETQARRESERLGREQPDLLAFVMAFTEELSPDAHELGVYLLHVVVAMFRAAAGHRVPRVKPVAIERQWTQDSEALERFEGAHERFLEQAAVELISSEPEVMRYVVEAIANATEDPDDPMELGEQDRGTLFLVLNTAVSLLHQAVELRRGQTSR